MGNIISYLEWRGDLSFRQSPFNEVDNLILSELAYLNFQGIVPQMGEGGAILLKEAAERFVQEKEPLTENKELCRLLEKMAQSRRFQNARLSEYMDVIDCDQEKTQFAAICIQLEDDTVYAAMMCRAEQKEQILEVFSNDGPGICPSMIDKKEYEKIKGRIQKIIPGFSIVGQLFEKEADCRIIESDGNGILQHDAFTWEVERDHFKPRGQLTEKCRLYNEIFDQWIESVEMEQREIFTNDFFQALSANGARPITEVVDGGIDGFEKILFAMGKSDRQSKIVAGK